MGYFEKRNSYGWGWVKTSLNSVAMLATQKVRTFALVTLSMILLIAGLSFLAAPVMGQHNFRGTTVFFNKDSRRNSWVINAPSDHTQLWIVPKVDGGYPFTDLGTVFWPNGNLTVKGSVSQGSSKELKENVASLSSQEAVDILADLNPVKYNYIADQSKTLNAGFIAEEVPELISTDEHKAVKTMDVIAVLTKVVKQQQEEVKILQGEIKLLKQNNNID